MNVGDKVGRWTVTQLVPSDYPRRAFVRCECGGLGLVSLHNFDSGTSKQCVRCVSQGARERARDARRCRRNTEAAE